MSSELRSRTHVETKTVINCRSFKSGNTPQILTLLISNSVVRQPFSEQGF
jgi:hypothetical protein